MKYKNTPHKVYIGLPVYNGAKTIEKAINSLLAQTFKNFILVISDNASNDETARICKKFLLKDSRIKYIRQKNNIGASANFKFLLENAKAAKLHDPVDYKKDPQEYCGMTINDNPFYDM